MFKWIRSFKSASNETKYFVIVTALFALLLVLSTIYSYARLDYVRSYKIDTNFRLW